MQFDIKRVLGMVCMAFGGVLITAALAPIFWKLLLLIGGIYLVIRGMGLYGVSFARWQTQAMMWAMRGR